MPTHNLWATRRLEIQKLGAGVKCGGGVRGGMRLGNGVGVSWGCGMGGGYLGAGR